MKSSDKKQTTFMGLTFPRRRKGPRYDVTSAPVLNLARRVPRTAKADQEPEEKSEIKAVTYEEATGQVRVSFDGQEILLPERYKKMGKGLEAGMKYLKRLKK